MINWLEMDSLKCDLHRHTYPGHMLISTRVGWKVSWFMYTIQLKQSIEQLCWRATCGQRRRDRLWKSTGTCGQWRSRSRRQGRDDGGDREQKQRRRFWILWTIASSSVFRLVNKRVTTHTFEIVHCADPRSSPSRHPGRCFPRWKDRRDEGGAWCTSEEQDVGSSPTPSRKKSNWMQMGVHCKTDSRG